MHGNCRGVIAVEEVFGVVTVSFIHKVGVLIVERFHRVEVGAHHLTFLLEVIDLILQ